MKKVEATAMMVIRGLYELLDRGPEDGVTAADIAGHLKATEESVLSALRELKQDRIFRDRRRKGRRIWGPW